MMEAIESSSGNGGLDAKTIVGTNIPPPFTVDSLGGEMSSELNEWFDRHIHPLMNNVVLDMVFKHVTRNELKQCRLVCKTWNESTIPFTRKKFVVTIYGNPNPQEKLHTIDNFVEVFRLNSMGIPFARFRLGSFCTTEGVGQEFLHLCGTTTKGIDFFFLEEKFRVEDVSEILKSTQKLETLRIPARLHSCSGNIVKLFPEDSKPRLAYLKRIKAHYDNPMERNKSCPTFLEEIITAAENISCLDLEDSSSTHGGEDQIFSSFEVLSFIEKLGRESSIQELRISLMNKNDSDYVKLLGKMASKRIGLKLKRLQYKTFSSDQEGQSSLLQVISIFKDTLEFLSIYWEHFISFVEFPQMIRLTHLEISFSKDFNSRFINLSKNFPVLERLRISRYYDPKYDEFFPESDPCPTITSLQLHGISLKPNGFNQMLRVFPNLTDFRVNINEDVEEILRIIWTQMTRLEALTLYGSVQLENSMDCLLTGISDHVLNEIRDVVKDLEKTTEVERRDTIFNLRNQYSQLPSIGNLTELRSLTLYMYGVGAIEGDRCEFKYLTDITGYLGFYSIKRLKEIIVTNSELTKTCCEILRDEMGLESWTFETWGLQGLQQIIPSRDFWYW